MCSLGRLASFGKWGNLAELQYFHHLMWRTDSLEKALMLGKIEGRRRSNRRWDGWMASPTRQMWVRASSKSLQTPEVCKLQKSANSRLQWRIVKAGMLQSMGSQRVRHNLVTEQLRFSSAKWFSLVTKYKIKD